MINMSNFFSNIDVNELKVKQSKESQLQKENDLLKLKINHVLQYVHDQVLKGNLSDEIADDVYDLLTKRY